MEIQLYTNYLTGNPYTGNNHNELEEFTTLMNFTDSRFLTYRQALTVGRVVKKGEKGVKLFRPCLANIEDKKTGKSKQKRVRKNFIVFNISQTTELETN